MFISATFWNIWEQKKELHYLQRASKVCQDLKKKATNQQRKTSTEKKKKNLPVSRSLPNIKIRTAKLENIVHDYILLSANQLRALLIILGRMQISKHCAT